MNYDFLTDLQKAKIEAFIADTDMYEAVRKVLLQGLYDMGVVKSDEPVQDPTINGAFHLAALAVQNPIPDEQIGANVRAMFAGLNALKNALDDLKGIKLPKGEAVESPFNEAE